MSISSHNSAAGGIIFTKHGASPFIHVNSRGRLLIVAVFIPAVPMFLIVVSRGLFNREITVWTGVVLLTLLRVIVASWSGIILAVVTIKVMIFRVVWKWPQLCALPHPPHCFQNLLLINPSCYCDLLQVHIYINGVHS